MLKHYFKLVLRHLFRNKVYTLINLLGLSLGIAACMVIYLVTSYELSFDRHHPDGERIFRVGGRVQESRGGGSEETVYMEDVPPPTAGALAEEVPGIGTAATFYSYHGRGHEETIITGPEYFSIFKYEWLAGNPASALKDPFSVVVSERKVRKYFGALAFDQVLGKEVVFEDSLRMRVSGVVKEWSEKTDIPYDEFVSFRTIGHSGWKHVYHTDDWRPGRDNPWARAFVKLAEGASGKGVEQQLAGFSQRHLRNDSLLRMVKFSLVLQPLGDMHFNEAYDHDGIRKAHMPALYASMGIAVFILLMAIANFINLSTAQSLQRARETGVRKVLGSSRGGLVRQYLAETFVLTFFAAGFAMLMVNPLLSLFREYVPPGVVFRPLSVSVLLFLFTVVVVTTFLAGFYPGWVLSSYPAVTNLKGGTVEKGRLRKGLIVFQFTLSLVFIIGVLGVRSQITYMMDTDAGISTDAIITVDSWNGSSDQRRLFRERVRQLPGVEGCVLQGHAPMGRAIIEQPMKVGDVEMFVPLLAGGSDLLSFYHMRLLAGRNMMESDSLRSFVINETYCKALGFTTPYQATGQWIQFRGKAYPIAGVVADFHTGSFHESIRPLAIGHIPGMEESAGIRVRNAAAVEKVKGVWKGIFPKEAFSFSWLDEDISKLYEKDRQVQRLVTVAMIVAVVIACMGVAGLMLFMVERRAREISIRKVLGAGLRDIGWLLSRDFVVLIVLSLLVATPIAWYGLHRWLQGFAYRGGVSWTLFAGAGLAAVFIVLCTISVQVIRVALASPVERLRAE